MFGNVVLLSYIYITEGGGSNFIIAILKFVLLYDTSFFHLGFFSSHIGYFP